MQLLSQITYKRYREFCPEEYGQHTLTRLQTRPSLKVLYVPKRRFDLEAGLSGGIRNTKSK